MEYGRHWCVCCWELYLHVLELEHGTMDKLIGFIVQTNFHSFLSNQNDYS